MTTRLSLRGRGEDGFTLIELLVVILIIGVLAAIAIPSFLNQKSKAYDAGAKELARSAQTTAETYGIDHGGTYLGLNLTEIKKYETGLASCPNSAGACLVKAEPVEENSGYIVETEANVSKDKFAITRSANGEVKRTCKSTTGSKNGCAGLESGSW